MSPNRPLSDLASGGTEPLWGIWGAIVRKGSRGEPLPDPLSVWTRLPRVWVQVDGEADEKVVGERHGKGDGGLQGEYALALWDLDAERLTCARDPFGTRPLFLAPLPTWDRGVAFASDIAALWRFPEVARSLALDEVARHLVHPLSTPLESVFQGIQILPPGHRFQWTARSGTPSFERLWTPSDARPLRFRTGADAVSELQHRLATAVRRRIHRRPQGRWGLHLSGGMDSSAVALHTPRSSPPGLGFSWSPAPDPGEWLDPQTDERCRIAALARMRGLDLHYPEGSLEALANDLLEWIFGDLAVEGTTDLFEEQSVLRTAARLGVTTLLSGWGGNEAVSFGGSGLPAYFLARGRLPSFWNTLGPPRGVRSHLRTIVRLGVTPLLPTPGMRGRPPAESPWGHPGWTNPYAHPSLFERFPHLRHVPERPPPPNDPRTVIRHLLGRPHLARRMETWARWAAPLGIQHRYPLLDLDLVEFVLGLPPELHFHDRQWRGLLWAAMREAIPPNEAPHFGHGALTLSRGDPRNEAKRMTLRRLAWEALAQDPRTDALLRQVPDGWIRTAELRADLNRPAMAEGRADIPRFKAMRESLRVAGVLVRYGEG